MKRQELIQAVKVLNTELPRPAHMMSSADLERVLTINAGGQGKSTRQRVTLRGAILSSASRGEDVNTIVRKLTDQGWGDRVRCGKVRPIYVKHVIKHSL